MWKAHEAVTRRRSWLLLVAMIVTIAPAALGDLVPIPGNLDADPRGGLPAVARLADGRFVVAYAVAESDNQLAVAYRHFDLGAQPLAPARTASTSPVVIILEDANADTPTILVPIFFSRPRLAVNEAGESLLVWAGGPGGAVDIRGRLLDPEGTPIGPEIAIHEAPGAQGNPVAVASGDGWFVAWQSRHATILGRRLDAAGQPLSPPLVLGDRAGGVQTDPALALLADGRLVLAWTAEPPPFEGGDIYARQLAADGTPLGPSVVVNTVRENFQGGAAVAGDPYGGFVVSWTSGANAEVDLVAQRFDAAGEPVGGEIEVNTNRPQQQLDSTIGFDAAGRFVIAWSQLNFSTNDPQAEALALRAFAADGTPFGPDSTAAPGPAAPTFNPSLAVTPGGEVVLAGTGGEGGVHLRRFTLTCASGPNVTCLDDTRIRLEASWRTRLGTRGSAHPTEFATDSTRFLWFFRPDNVEMVVKLHDACAANGHHWVFAAGLTSVETVMRIVDTWTGSERVYRSPLGMPFAPLQDTRGFGPCGQAPP